MKDNAPEHPKMHALAERLNIPHAHAVGIMEMLWHLATRFAPAGDIGRYSAAYIAKQLSWTGDPDELVAALVEVRWLDPHDQHIYIVHDWPEHCRDTVHYWLAQRRLVFADGSRPKTTRYKHPDQARIQADYDNAVEPGDLPFQDYWDEFWAHWPRHRKVNRIRAQQVWTQKATSEERARQIIEGLRIHLQPGGVLANPNPRYIPGADSWLRNERWNDVYAPTQEAIENFVLDRDPTDDDLLRGLLPTEITE